MIAWAATWQHYIDDGYDYFFTIHACRQSTHTELLKCWYKPEEFNTRRGRRNCLKRLRRKGLRVVKVEVREAK